MNLISNEDSKERFLFLDGLRGIAALVVFFWHFASAFYPLIDPHFKTAWIMETPVWLFFNGAYAVMIFFVLSGFVLSLSTTHSKSNFIILLVGRYLRLTIPILVSLLFAWTCLHFFSGSRVQLRTLTQDHWLNTNFFGAHIPGPWVAVKDALYKVYVTGGSLYNNVLWSMKIELIGSVGIFVVYKIIPSRFRWYGLGALTMLFFMSHWYLGFPVGALIQEGWSRKWIRPHSFAWAFLATGLACAMFGKSTTLSNATIGSLYALGAGLVVLSIFQLQGVRTVLAAPVPRFLGRISFSFYLIHVPVLISIGAWLYFHSGGGIRTRVAILLPVLLMLCTFLAWVMTVTVDEPLVRKLRQLKQKQVAEK